MGGLTMTNDRFHQLFGAPPRTRESVISQKEMDLARSVQDVTEMVMMRLAQDLQKKTGMENLCLAGGVALNCVGNGKVLRDGPFKKLWIQPAAGDAGGALGAALFAWHQILGNPRTVRPDGRDTQKATLLGPDFTPEEALSQIEAFIKKATGDEKIQLKYRRIDDEKAYCQEVARCIASEKVIGWCQGRMEYGPRALGARSIIGDPRSPRMQSKMNLKIKYRESFRPFAPTVLREDVAEYFDLNAESPYMLRVAPVRESLRKQLPPIPRLEGTPEQQHKAIIDWVNQDRSTIPAVTHVDFSARVQTVAEWENSKYYNLIKAFKEQTGCGVIVNTSYNVRGEPIICTPEDAYRCFMRTEMDVLAVGPFIFFKEEQPELKKDDGWKQEFELD